MIRAPLTDDELFAALDAAQYFESSKDAAKSLGLNAPTYRWNLNAAKERVVGYELTYDEPVEGFSTSLLLTDELIEHMISRYNKRRNAKDARHPIYRSSSNLPIL